MTTDNLPDLEAEVARRTEAAMRRDALRQTHKRLAEARTQLKNLRHLPVESAIEGRLVHLIVNDIEPLMWRVEQRIAELQKEDAR